MKRIVFKLYALCCMLVFPGMAYATLIDVSSTLVYDDTTSQYWYRNINDFNNMAGNDFAIGNALQWATTNYYGLSNWHLASLTELNTLMNGTTAEEFSNHFAPTGFIDPAHLHLDLGPGNYKYFVGGTNSYSLITGTTPPLHEPMDIFFVRVNYDSSDLAQLAPISKTFSVADGPQWTRGGEIGAWVTAQGPSPVPEPCTVLLLGAGMVGLAGVRILRRKI